MWNSGNITTDLKMLYEKANRQNKLQPTIIPESLKEAAEYFGKKEGKDFVVAKYYKES